MNKGTKKRILSGIALCTVTMSMLMSTGCGNTEKKKKIAVITKQDIAFWHDVKAGAEDAAKDFGLTLLYNEGGETDYPVNDNDYATQIEYINYAIKEKVDAIVIAPNGTVELNEAFARAENAGIKLININSRANYGGILSCVSSSDEDGGHVAARHAADGVLLSDAVRLVMKQAGGATIEDVKKLGKGAVAIIGHTAATADRRIGGFKNETATQIVRQMAADGLDLTSMGLTQEQISEMFGKFFVDGEKCGTIDAAYEEAKKILTAKDSNVICFFATNTNTTLGVCKAVDELGLKDSVYVIGFNSDDKEITYLKDDVLDGTVIQNPYNMGYVGVRYAKNAAAGDGIPGALDTGVTYITKDNLNDEYIQLLLHPDRY